MPSKTPENIQLGMLAQNPTTLDERPLHYPLPSEPTSESEAEAVQQQTANQLPETGLPQPPTAATVEHQQQEIDTTGLEVKRLSAYQGLLEIFGNMNKSQNLQNRFADSPWVANRVAARIGKTSPRALLEQSRDKLERDGDEAIEKVGQMLGAEALVDAGVVTKKQAKAIVETTYEHYKSAYQGLDPQTMKARKSQLGKVDRRLKKLKGSK